MASGGRGAEGPRFMRRTRHQKVRDEYVLRGLARRYLRAGEARNKAFNDFVSCFELAKVFCGAWSQQGRLVAAAVRCAFCNLAYYAAASALRAEGRRIRRIEVEEAAN